MNKTLLFFLTLVASSPIFSQDQSYRGKDHNFNSSSMNSQGIRSDTSTLTPPKIILMKPGGVDMDVQIVGSGIAVSKYSCPAGKSLGIFASVVTMCDNGLSNIISGQHITALNGVGTITPQLWVFTNRGSGGAWNLVDSSCGRLELRQVCQ